MLSIGSSLFITVPLYSCHWLGCVVRRAAPHSTYRFAHATWLLPDGLTRIARDRGPSIAREDRAREIFVGFPLRVNTPAPPQTTLPVQIKLLFA